MGGQKIKLIPEDTSYISGLSNLEGIRKIIGIDKLNPIRHEHFRLIMERTNIAVELIVSERVKGRNGEMMILTKEVTIGEQTFKIPLKFYTQNISSEKIKKAS